MEKYKSYATVAEFPKPEVSEWTESRHTVTFKFPGELQRPETFENVIDMIRLAPGVKVIHSVTSTHRYIARF